MERSVSGLGIKGLLRRGSHWAGGGKIRLGLEMFAVGSPMAVYDLAIAN